MSIEIYTNGEIHIDGADTGLSVRQREDGTAVYVRGGDPVDMPQPRYSLAADRPLSGAPGRKQFEADIRALINA